MKRLVVLIGEQIQGNPTFQLMLVVMSPWSPLNVGLITPIMFFL